LKDPQDICESKCLVEAVRPFIKGESAMIIEEWGYPMKSILSVEEDGQCLHFIYENTVAPSPYSTTAWEYNIDGHILKLHEGPGAQPDSIEVIPSVGWELITDSPMVAPDWDTSVITICQMLLG
jgi:hypothetical protein